jgi:hypothetical protein
MSARRWAEFLMPDAVSMQFDWLREAVQGDRGLLAAIAQSPTARRLLNRRVQREQKIPVPRRMTLAPHQQWLLASPAAQVALARRLGLEALRNYIRTTVRASSVAALRKQLGDEEYRRAVAEPALPVTGLDRARFDAAVARGDVQEHATSVGAALLETTTPSDDNFCRVRMRFAFSSDCWHARPQGLKVERNELVRRIGAQPEG